VKCNYCGKRKSAEEFYSTRPKCKRCVLAAHKVRRAVDPERTRERQRKWDAARRRRLGQKFTPRFSDPAERFWIKVKRTDASECWLWTAYRNVFGYGVFSGVRGKLVLAHRFAWTTAHGDIPDGAAILHHCDNPPCVNPSHLFLGDQPANVRDMIEKGRSRRSRGDSHWTRRNPEKLIGARNPNAKLSDKQVAQMRALWDAGGVTFAALGRQFGVDPSHARNIALRRKRVSETVPA